MEQKTPDNPQLEFLQQFLADRDEQCPVCAYNLRGLQSDHCPECGAKIEMRIGSSDLRLRYWITSVILLVLPIGFALPMTVIGLIFWLDGEFTTGSDAIMLAVFAGTTLLFGTLLVAAVVRRRAFWRKSAAAQLQRTLACVALVGLVIVAYIVVFAIV